MAKTKKDYIKEAILLLEAHLNKLGLNPESEDYKNQIKTSTETLEALKIDDIIASTADARAFYEGYEYTKEAHVNGTEREQIYKEIEEVWTMFISESGADAESEPVKKAHEHLKSEMDAETIELLKVRLQNAQDDLKRLQSTKGQSKTAKSDIIDSASQDKETLELMKKAAVDDLKVLTESLKTSATAPEVIKAGKPRVIAGQSSYLDKKTGQTHFDSIEQVRLIVKFNPARFTILS